MIGGTVTGGSGSGSVTGGLTIGGRVTGGLTIGGSVTGGFTMGGRVTGGLTMGGNVTGGRVIGGFTMGGRVIGPFPGFLLGLWGLGAGLPQEPHPRIGVAVEMQSMQMRRRALILEESISLLQMRG